jgi:peptidoglycan/LPS O-acetylase OafA/YrhL
VNIFFTLSGFLITALLLVELEARGKVWFAGFYARRALRLIPPLLLALALVALLPNVYVGANNGVSISRWYSIPAALFYVANIVAALGHPLGFLAHTWSLAVEEQFYLLWPALLVLLASRRLLGKALPVLIILAIVSRAAMTAGDVRGVPDWLISQTDQLLIGALLAVGYLRGGLSSLRREPAGWLALAALAALVVIGTATKNGSEGHFALYGGLTVAGIASAVLIGHLMVSDGSTLSALFAFTPFVWIGRVSYGIYLFHFPIFQWVQHERWASKPKEYAVEYALLAIAVAVSWFLVERPALRLKNRRARPKPIVQALEPAPDTV